MATKLKVVEAVADIVPAPVLQPVDPVDRSDPHSPEFPAGPPEGPPWDWNSPLPPPVSRPPAGPPPASAISSSISR